MKWNWITLYLIWHSKFRKSIFYIKNFPFSVKELEQEIRELREEIKNLKTKKPKMTVGDILDDTEKVIFEIKIYIIDAFSWPEPKAEVSYFDLVICPLLLSTCRCRHYTLFEFLIPSQEPMGQFYQNLPWCIFGWRGFRFIQMKEHTSFKGEITKNSKNGVGC